MTLAAKCVCGWDIPGDSVESRQAAYADHVATVHPGLELAEHDLRDYLLALERMDPPGPRVDVLPPIEVHAVTPDRIPDALHFFDHVAFADNPRWAACYCMAHHLPRAEWPLYTAADTRRSQEERLHRGATIGYLAYAPDGPVGWCNASLRTEYVDYDAEAPPAPGPVGAIACFVIAAPYRRHGIGRLLLDAAIQGFRDRQVATVEAYPVRDPNSDAGAYHGPLSLYLGAGFTESGEFGNWVVVRKSLVT